jgi:hypothetical protein
MTYEPPPRAVLREDIRAGQNEKRDGIDDAADHDRRPSTTAEDSIGCPGPKQGEEDDGGRKSRRVVVSLIS